MIKYLLAIISLVLFVSSAEAAFVPLGANNILGSLAGVPPAGQALSIPSCSTSTSALIWTSGSGFSCNTAIVSASTTGNATTVTNGIYSTDTGTVTNAMLAGSIANGKLLNSSLTVNGTAISLGASGTVTAAAGTLTGTTLASGVTASSLTSFGASIALGTPASGVATNLTGTAASLTAGNVTTNANLTGPITSAGNATSVASQSGTGSTFMMTASPSATGTLGAAAISATSTVTGTAFIPSSSAIPTDGLYKPASNTSGIADNSQPVEEYSGVASAVDYMLVTNSATGNPGNISYAVTGTDTNIGENHTLKGVGLFTILYTGADSAGNNGPFTVDTSGSTLSGNPAFKIVLPASGLHKAFQFSNGTDTTAWASFQFDLGGTGLAGLALGAGGSSTRDLFLYRSAANTLNVATAAGNSSGTLNAGIINGGGNLTITSGDISIATAGKGIKIKSGSNARIGTGTLTAGTVTIANTSVTANTRVFLTDTSSSTTNVGSLTVSAISAGTSFTVTSTLALDVSTFNWMLVESQ